MEFAPRTSNCPKLMRCKVLELVNIYKEVPALFLWDFSALVGAI
jgi:hypothetical protein